MTTLEYADLIDTTIFHKGLEIEDVKTIIVSSAIFETMAKDLKDFLMPFYTREDLKKMMWRGVTIEVDNTLESKEVKIVAHTKEV